MTTQWIKLAPEAAAVLRERLNALPDHCHHFVGGSLHVDEFHVVDDDPAQTVYRYFVATSADSTRIESDTELEMAVEVEDASEAPQTAEDGRRRRQLMLYRAYDSYRAEVEAMPCAPEVRAELLNQLTALHRMAVTLNSPGKAVLSPAKLASF